MWLVIVGAVLVGVLMAAVLYNQHIDRECRREMEEILDHLRDERRRNKYG